LPDHSLASGRSKPECRPGEELDFVYDLQTQLWRLDRRREEVARELAAILRGADPPAPEGSGDGQG
jgi:hypothetical protein